MGGGIRTSLLTRSSEQRFQDAMTLGGRHREAAARAQQGATLPYGAVAALSCGLSGGVALAVGSEPAAPDGQRCSDSDAPSSVSAYPLVLPT